MPVKNFSLNRREFVAGTAALAAAAALPHPVFATSKVTLGDFEVMTFTDGHINLPAGLRAPNADEEKWKEVLERAGRKGDTYISPINVTLVKTPDELILIDFGSGPRFVPTTGKLEAALSDGGIDPGDVTKVILTHGHPDHLWGATNDFDELTFPEATYYVAEKEFAFWKDADAMKSLPEERQFFAVGAKARFESIEERIQFVKEDDEVVSGIRVFDTHGHTQGHISVELKQGSESIVVLGDALTNPVLSFEFPEWHAGTDHLPEVGAATRKKLLDQLFTSKAKIIGYHLPPPGIGMVVKKGSGYAYEAIA
ncbi:MAG: MBL fold metallo-hydrolase [Alphaproteobacteria bacterium]|nr:MBL fold metallo-hydrolase [Alphaproteobacteria bacterium]